MDDLSQSVSHVVWKGETMESFYFNEYKKELLYGNRVLTGALLIAFYFFFLQNFSIFLVNSSSTSSPTKELSLLP